MKQEANLQQQIFTLSIWFIGSLYFCYGLWNKNFYYIGIGFIIITNGYIYAEQFNTEV
jgi:hypothetical protein